MSMGTIRKVFSYFYVSGTFKVFRIKEGQFLMTKGYNLNNGRGDYKICPNLGGNTRWFDVISTALSLTKYVNIRCTRHICKQMLTVASAVTVHT